MSEQLTLQDWEKLFNMVKASEASDKELREKITQLEERLKQSEARIPKTGLLSHSILTRIFTVCGYIFFVGIIWYLFLISFQFLAFPIHGSSWSTTLLPGIIILTIFIVVLVVMARRARSDVELKN